MTRDSTAAAPPLQALDAVSCNWPATRRPRGNGTAHESSRNRVTALLVQSVASPANARRSETTTASAWRAPGAVST